MADEPVRWRGREGTRRTVAGEARVSVCRESTRAQRPKIRFTVDGPDTMIYVQTIPGKGSRTLAMVRTKSPRMRYTIELAWACLVLTATNRVVGH